MIITKVGKSGTLESSDILIMVVPNKDHGINIELESIVMKQFGDQIKNIILDQVKKMNIQNIKIIAQDKGSLDCTIRARVETAINRAM
ncbi:MAG TPA: citrate lyase acyl carrier protein [Clostridium sp.]|uniref:citrate lyase acyl carrier protein n=1 Tax=Clostridium sp. TaxID=1506 RepID=UPI002F9575E1